MDSKPFFDFLRDLLRGVSRQRREQERRDDAEYQLKMAIGRLPQASLEILVGFHETGQDTLRLMPGQPGLPPLVSRGFVTPDVLPELSLPQDYSIRPDVRDALLEMLDDDHEAAA